MNSSTAALISSQTASWSSRYGDRHKLERIVDFPKGVAAPEKIRLYWRYDHYVLQWWDRSEHRTLSDRVNGDLVAAITRARDIEKRMNEIGRSGIGRSRLTCSELIDHYLKDAGERAASGEIDLRTVVRYRSALEYLRVFSEQLAISRSYSHAASIDRRFLLEFGAFLQERLISPNGHKNTASRQMRGQHYVLQSVRSAFSWAADPERGKLLPAEFRSPFQRTIGAMRRPTIDPTREPPITIEMAVQFVASCDEFQLRLFLPLILFGLRASEPMWLFHEDVEQQWLNVRSHPGLDYQTKGRRDKRIPLLPTCTDIWEFWLQQRTAGLMLRKRISIESPALAFDACASQHQTRCHNDKMSIVARRQSRDQLMREFGAINYDQIDSEFRHISKELDWKSTATLKGFRHLFATSLENSGCPESYRRYFLGHSQGRASSVNYTHLDQLQRHFGRFLVEEYAGIIEAIRVRIAGISMTEALSGEHPATTTADSRPVSKRKRSA
ncbi:MAG TPA: tyrosine-type recombinase/integrase [Schlesneria sp.]|jgi:integrase